MKRLIINAAFLLLCMHANAQKLDIDRQLDYCHQQIKRALTELRQTDGSYDYAQEPRNILSGDKQKGWNTREAKPEEWCSGFWPGILWMDYSNTGDPEVLQAAEGYTESLRPIASRKVFDHDLGFLMHCSFGKGYEVTHRDDYRRTILQTSDSLATLFNPLVGTILSWPRECEPQGWPHNTIMDNMINLDILFWAANNGGNPLLKDIAVTHAKTTMQNHFRPDGTCYHVAVYDTLSGNFIKGVTHQGYADNSTWARGQSWAIYGFTMVYRWTGLPIFLEFAQKVTDVYLKKLGVDASVGLDKAALDGKDLIPAWDFDDPRGSKAPKDASAACVVASALLELSGMTGGEKGNLYKAFALESLSQLSTPEYQCGEEKVAFLKHSTGHHPAGSEIDASIIYADYYYLEALLRAKSLATE